MSIWTSPEKIEKAKITDAKRSDVQETAMRRVQDGHERVQRDGNERSFTKTAKRLQQYEMETPRQETANRLQQYKIEPPRQETANRLQSTESQETGMSQETDMSSETVTQKTFLPILLISQHHNRSPTDLQQPSVSDR